MTLAANVRYLGPTHLAGQVQPCSLSSKWQTVIAAGGPAVQDAASITNPTTQIVNSTTSIFYKGAYGTNILIRLGYDDGLTSITSPVIRVFGRTGTDAWQALENKASSETITLTTDSADVTDGTLLYTDVDASSHQVDTLGCEEIIIGIQTALAGTGSTANSIIQVKLI